MPGSLQTWKAFVIVFVASVCTMVIELVAARVLAPYVGVSLYTWTSIIGVVLAGISAGNYVGGLIADRWASKRTIGILFIISGLLTIGVVISTATIVGGGLGRDTLPLVARIVLYTLLVFLPPCFMLGTISPVVIKLTLKSLERTGNVVGRIYAISTIGSIIGTFLTGFVLISTFGTREIIWMVAGILLVLGVVFGELWRSIPGSVATTAVIIGATLLYANRPADWSAPCVRETNYYCIRFTDTTIDGVEVRSMVLDHLIHSYSSISDPTFVGYGYERIYVELTDYYVQTRERADIATLSIGGGGYTFPRYLEATLPESHIEVIEIDPAVTEEAFRWMGLDPESRIITHNEDARQFVLRESANGSRRFDIVYGDAFNDLSVPYHLTTKEFHDQLKALMRPDGIYMINVIDNLRSGEFMRAHAKTLRETFAHVYIAGLSSNWTNAGTSTYVVLASDAPIDLERFRQIASRDGERPIRTSFMPQDQLAAYLDAGTFLLTDNYAPVDNLVARLFVERGY